MQTLPTPAGEADGGEGLGKAPRPSLVGERTHVLCAGRAEACPQAQRRRPAVAGRPRAPRCRRRARPRRCARRAPVPRPRRRRRRSRSPAGRGSSPRSPRGPTARERWRGNRRKHQHVRGGIQVAKLNGRERGRGSGLRCRPCPRRSRRRRAGPDPTPASTSAAAGGRRPDARQASISTASPFSRAGRPTNRNFVCTAVGQERSLGSRDRR